MCNCLLWSGRLCPGLFPWSSLANIIHFPPRFSQVEKYEEQGIYIINKNVTGIIQRAINYYQDLSVLHICGHLVTTELDWSSLRCFQVTSVAETLRVSKKTPMSLILAEWGLEPDVKYLNWSSNFWDKTIHIVKCNHSYSYNTEVLSLHTKYIDYNYLVRPNYWLQIPWDT